MQAFLNDRVAGLCSDLPSSFPLEKLRLLGSLPGAGISAAAHSSPWCCGGRAGAT